MCYIIYTQPQNVFVELGAHVCMYSVIKCVTVMKGRKNCNRGEMSPVGMGTFRIVKEIPTRSCLGGVCKLSQCVLKFKALLQSVEV